MPPKAKAQYRRLAQPPYIKNGKIWSVVQDKRIVRFYTGTPENPQQHKEEHRHPSTDEATKFAAETVLKQMKSGWELWKRSEDGSDPGPRHQFATGNAEILEGLNRRKVDPTHNISTIDQMYAREDGLVVPISKKNFTKCDAPETVRLLSETEPYVEKSIRSQLMGLHFNIILAKINIDNNVDEYYMMQVLTRPGKDAVTDEAWIYNERGMQGGEGSSRITRYDTVDLAHHAFHNEFQSKTGIPWPCHDTNAPVPGKLMMVLENLVENKTQKRNVPPTVWQYRPINMDGSDTVSPWSNFSEDDSYWLERLALEYRRNPLLVKRIIRRGSESYLIDYHLGIQTIFGGDRSVSNLIRRSGSGPPLPICQPRIFQVVPPYSD
eukprot:Plantae.Rhodophyta-Hildenbrandia_rubra.ctg5689.p1 GENE.Plantae.Rhodophyta-Hildenbrandia_rubra.ctg5689~~Plantae.Rhodophyta-Hildenbrandia_rubra.ctg5689.p1  ORF type:complete len:379 (+),score=43.40 Plantae.Rhodophyta-Hildenbrandia_rubra.ctg5689:524-1660(+)